MINKKLILNVYKDSLLKSKLSTQLLYGEKFEILSKNKNSIKIKSTFDNYVGYTQNYNFEKKFVPYYKVFKLKAKIFKKPNIKKINETNYYLSFASRVSFLRRNKKFIEFEKNKWIKKNDVKKVNHIEKNFTKIFKLFLKTKYIWGGKSYVGLDCSAILQLFFYYNNIFYPRDTKDQIRYSKKINRKKFKKGDIIFWKGHVAICLNSRNLIHAYGPKKKVLTMPINYTIKKIKETANLKVKKISNILN